MATNRVLPCDVCGVEVKLQRDRFLRLVQNKERPICRQCRRYVRPKKYYFRDVLGDTSRTPLVFCKKKTNMNEKRIEALPLNRCIRPK